MSERPFDPARFEPRRYGEMRCRRYLFERPPGASPADADPAAGDVGRPAPGPEGWAGVRRPQ